MSDRKPEYKLKALNKKDDSHCEVGAGWLNANGSISITINPCVTLTRDANIVLMLFPVLPDR